MSKLFECVGLTKKFGGFTAIENLNLTIDEGEIRAIIGPNGAGKTTLFNLMTGLLPCTGGHIYFRGEEITHLPPHVIARKGISRSFQITNVFGGLSVFENVRIAVQAIAGHDRFGILRKLPQLKQIEETAWHVLEQIELTKLADQKAELLSHGDQRRLELGLVLAIDAAVIFLDEPMAGMSPEESRESVELIRKVAGGRTLVIVEHDMDVVFSLADRITVMSRGDILAEGTPEEIRTNEAVRDTYLGVAT